MRSIFGNKKLDREQAREKLFTMKEVCPDIAVFLPFLSLDLLQFPKVSTQRIMAREIKDES